MRSVMRRSMSLRFMARIRSTHPLYGRPLRGLSRAAWALERRARRSRRCLVVRRCRMRCSVVRRPLTRTPPRCAGTPHPRDLSIQASRRINGGGCAGQTSEHSIDTPRARARLAVLCTTAHLSGRTSDSSARSRSRSHYIGTLRARPAVDPSSPLPLSAGPGRPRRLRRTAPAPLLVRKGATRRCLVWVRRTAVARPERA